MIPPKVETLRTGARLALRGVVLASWAIALSCGADSTPTQPTPQPAPLFFGPRGDAVFVGAGDIAQCRHPGPTMAAEWTASVLDRISGTVFTAGDNAYFGGGGDSEFLECYEPTWGRHKDRTRPSPGNHDYETTDAAGYFRYFGSSAGPSGVGYYSYPVGDWHVISLNSNIAVHGGSPQAMWLRDDLQRHPSRCTVAYFHHPLFSSGVNGGHNMMRDIWTILYDADVDLIISAHDHVYERFAPQDANGRPDSARGIRQFVVGTGGAELTRFPVIRPNSEARSTIFGVLKLTLQSSGYSWEFIRAPEGRIEDSGSGVCH